MDSTDLNNNSAEEKIYSLRPRASIKSNREFDQEEDIWKPRGRTKKRTKQKSAPLSKYRRKTANARERSRMREINEAFEALRRAVPHLNSNSENPGEKISKIMTLRLAMKYITALSTALQEPCFGETSLSDVMLSCEGMLTPGSISEPSEFGDDFFATQLPSESMSSTSPSYDVPGLVTPPLNDTLHLPPFNHLRPEPVAQSTQVSLPSSSTLLQALTSEKIPYLHQNQPIMRNNCDLRSHTLTPPDDLCRNSFSYQFKENSLPSSTFATPSFLTDFDGLPSPAMDFEDLFIK
ncbi:class A basic helix-loop-helix protein 9-like [Macrosteles quadrilineatus]|uniref:class A basic helix-loop-helix protein 9-like n=1 Tax=Macrosteles quadrilineatus TaxID=74068 RepID=UPI0023E09164|nr:class A basic helix-loop-helix protein 9-like [Macrosteles quadrilineatus]